MTAEGSEIRNPDFLIWFPQVDPSSDEIRCGFDAVRAGAVLMRKGTEEMCRVFLERLGISANEIHDWRVERICTPFFTDLPDSSDWRDRYRVSWRVTIHAAVAGPVLDPEAGPVGVATDATWRMWSPDPTPGIEMCEVLAVELTEQGSGSSEALFERLHQRFPDYPVTVEEVVDQHRVARLGRIRVGQLTVEDELDELDAINDACAAMGLATTIPAFELLRARVR